MASLISSKVLRNLMKSCAYIFLALVVVNVILFGTINHAVTTNMTEECNGFEVLGRSNMSRCLYMDPDRYAIPPGSACHVDRLGANDTDTDVINGCRFPVVSTHPQVISNAALLKKVNLPTLNNYRNPCWYERLPDGTSHMYQANKTTFMDQAATSYDVMRPIMNARIASGYKWRIRCIPLVYLIGVAKCGTTDLFNHMRKHPNVVKGATKEPMFWNMNLWRDRGDNFDNYLDLYDEAAEVIRKTTTEKIINGRSMAYHPLITVDGSVSYFFRYEGAKSKEFDSSPSKVRLTAHHIKNTVPNAKIILMLRNPTDRLYSEYIFFNNGHDTTAETFDRHALEAVERMRNCLMRNHVNMCVFDAQAIDHHDSWVRLVAGMYVPFVRIWLNVFPHMKIYRTEDYHKNRTTVYDDVIRYTQLDYIIPPEVKSGGIVNKGPPKKPMMDRTRALLDDFYRPFNAELANVLRDRRYLFNE